MGCYNLTCDISNLPIRAGDKVILIPLVKRTHGEVHPCYPSDCFAPIGFPVLAEYDEYGGVENSIESEANKIFFKNFSFIDYNGEEKYRGNYNNFDSFVNEAFCYNGSFLKEDGINNFNDGKSELTYMMVHSELYSLLLEEISNRVPYGQENKYRDCLYNYSLNKIEHSKKYFSEMMEGLSSEDGEKIFNALLFLEEENLIRKILFCNSIFSNRYWKSIVKIKNKGVKL